MVLRRAALESVARGNVTKKSIGKGQARARAVVLAAPGECRGGKSRSRRQRRERRPELEPIRPCRDVLRIKRRGLSEIEARARVNVPAKELANDARIDDGGQGRMSKPVRPSTLSSQGFRPASAVAQVQWSCGRHVARPTLTNEIAAVCPLGGLPVPPPPFWSGMLDLVGHVGPLRCHPAVCLPDARLLRSVSAPLAF